MPEKKSKLMKRTVQLAVKSPEIWKGLDQSHTYIMKEFPLDSVGSRIAVLLPPRVFFNRKLELRARAGKPI